VSEITSITAQSKDKRRCNVYVDGRFYCGLTLESVVKSACTPRGQTIRHMINRIKSPLRFIAIAPFICITLIISSVKDEVNVAFLWGSARTLSFLVKRKGSRAPLSKNFQF